ncbi:copper fist DNA binding domain-containing protein [Fennellomyces sp. T-0311]|nr:copper fist DNA binding domain-containing protein [Fennellomyces sp. T-0311]
MIVDGIKLACATCIKGHRASQCGHKDRPLIEIKKKGRPATQCKRCRELRTVRQLHVKCDCNDSLGRSRKRTNPPDKVVKESAYKLNLRLIAPKPQPLEAQQPLQVHSPPQQEQLPHQPALPGNSNSGDISCCSSNTNSHCSSTPSDSSCCSTTPRNVDTPRSSVSATPSGCGCSTKEHPPDESENQTEKAESSSCCGTKTVNRVRVITCRCGDSCSCPGCDAHPSRAMKGRNDPYTGFTTEDSRRRLSIAAICLPSDTPTSKRSDQPTSILSEDGVPLCGCGCSQSLESCSDCFRELCQGY